jgi:hypothetical protein
VRTHRSPSPQGAPPVLVLDLHAAHATARLTEFIASHGAAFTSKARGRARSHTPRRLPRCRRRPPFVAL